MRTIGKNMKLGITGLFIFAIAVFTACDGMKQDDAKTEAEEALNNFEQFVEEVKQDVKSESERTWAQIKQEYEQKKAKVEEVSEEMDKEMQQRYEKARNKFEKVKLKLINEGISSKHEPVDQLKTVLLTTGDELDLSSVNAYNLREVYKNFVIIVDEHQEQLSPEEWKEVDKMWNALNKRKNELEGQLEAEDKMRIADHKVEYAAIKTQEKVESTVEETVENEN